MSNQKPSINFGNFGDDYSYAYLFKTKSNDFKMKYLQMRDFCNRFSKNVLKIILLIFVA